MKDRLRYSDEQIIRELKTGKDMNDAIRALYTSYAGYVSSFIISYGASEQDAQDVFQETVIAFISIVQNGKYRGESNLKTFLVSVAKNIWLNQSKKRERSGKREKVFEDSRGQQEGDISHLIGDRENREALRELIFRLDESCRKILVLFYYENLSMKEITSHLHYENDQVVRNKKYKCLQCLVEMIKNVPGLSERIKTINN